METPRGWRLSESLGKHSGLAGGDQLPEAQCCLASAGVQLCLGSTKKPTSQCRVSRARGAWKSLAQKDSPGLGRSLRPHCPEPAGRKGLQHPNSVRSPDTRP